jgi:hypothetical protein
MAAWIWLVAYLAGFALLQVLLYRYLRDSQGTGTVPSGTEAASVAAVERTEPDGDGVRCGRCGAANDRGYSYCRNCAGQL